MESFLHHENRFDIIYECIFPYIEAVCETAEKFGDHNFVRFIRKYGKNPWFIHTRQAYKCLLYIKFLTKTTDGKLLGYIGLGMPPSHIKILIESGVNVNSKEDSEQGTPLIKACSTGSYETVKMLLDAGADPRLKTIRNQSALSLAFKHNSYEVFLLIYDALFQRNPNESELLQYFTWMDPNIHNIIKQTQGDKIMLKITQRLHKFMDGQLHMNAKELGYSFEKLANYDHVDTIATNLLMIGNDQNNSQMIHVLLHTLFRQKTTQVILNGYRHALGKICKPNVLCLYVSYLWRLGEENK